MTQGSFFKILLNLEPGTDAVVEFDCRDSWSNEENGINLKEQLLVLLLSIGNYATTLCQPGNRLLQLLMMVQHNNMVRL